MIRLTRLNNEQLLVNPDLIEHVELTPDTVITLINGQKIMVRETAEEIVERVIAYRRRVLDGVSGAVLHSGARYRPESGRHEE